MRLLDRKIPSILAVLVITTGIIATTFLIKGGNSLQVNAGPGQTPKNIEVSNISDTGFTITYTTDDEVIGTINSGENPKNLNIKNIDNRDKESGSVGKHQTHMITVDNLKPDSRYYYTITSGNKTYSNNDDPYVTKTSSTFGEISNIQNLISGKVITSDGLVPKDGIVVIKISGAQILSTLIDDTGSYAIQLNNLKNFDLESLYEFGENMPVNIDIFAENQNSKIQLSTDLLSDIPIITISNNYDFSEINDNSPKDTRDNAKFPEFSSKLKTKSSGQSIKNTTPINL